MREGPLYAGSSSPGIIPECLLCAPISAPYTVPIRDSEYFPYVVIPTPIRHLSEFFLESKPGLYPIDFSEGSTMDSGRYSYLK